MKYTSSPSKSSITSISKNLARTQTNIQTQKIQNKSKSEMLSGSSSSNSSFLSHENRFSRKKEEIVVNEAEQCRLQMTALLNKHSHIFTSSKYSKDIPLTYSRKIRSKLDNITLQYERHATEYCKTVEEYEDKLRILRCNIRKWMINYSHKHEMWLIENIGELEDQYIEVIEALIEAINDVDINTRNVIIKSREELAMTGNWSPRGFDLIGKSKRHRYTCAKSLQPINEEQELWMWMSPESYSHSNDDIDIWSAEEKERDNNRDADNDQESIDSIAMNAATSKNGSDDYEFNQHFDDKEVKSSRHIRSAKVAAESIDRILSILDEIDVVEQDVDPHYVTAATHLIASSLQDKIDSEKFIIARNNNNGDNNDNDSDNNDSSNGRNINRNLVDLAYRKTIMLGTWTSRICGLFGCDQEEALSELVYVATGKRRV